METVAEITWHLWRQRLKKKPFFLFILKHLAGVFKFFHFGEHFSNAFSF